MKPFKWLLLSAVVLAAPEIYSQKVSGESGDYRAEIDKTFEVQPGSNLIVNVNSGDINIESWDKNIVKISAEIALDVYTREEAAQVAEAIEKGIRRSENAISIELARLTSWAEAEYQITVPKKININVKNQNGEISIQGIDGTIDLFTAGGDIQAIDMAGELRANTSGGDLLFEDISGPLSGRSSGGDVSLSKIYGEATVETSGGDIELHTATKRVHLNTAGGDIVVENVEAELGLVTAGGDIQLRYCSGTRASASTNGGDIVLENIASTIQANTSGGDITGQMLSARVDVRTMGGDIDLTDVQAAVSANSMGGDVSVEITLKDFKKLHTVDMQTTGGTIELILPPKIPASITAEIRTDTGWSDSRSRYDIYSDFPLTKSTPSETGERILRSSGEINGGGDKIYLRANGGDIYIKKQNNEKNKER